MDQDRRRLLGLLTAGASAALAAAVAVPVLGLVLGPLCRKGGQSGDAAHLPLGLIGDFPEGVPTRVAFEVTTRDGWTQRTDAQSAWVLRQGAGATVFTATCPHLGCQVAWKSQRTRFECPCHDSGFSADGARLHGPAKRGLDPLPSRVAGGRLEVRWVEYEPGRADRRVLGGGSAGASA